ncbi:MAG TPA: molybdopterin molybdenumtransferase MoeA [Gammaproteobacteria bacterium]|nr:molybdopterin molybdenumtransferase MoeA [Gammaproteobacteria bacterium]
MPEASPLQEAQQRFVDALPRRSLPAEDCHLEAALGRILYEDLTAPEDMPPYPRAIVEGFLVRTEDTAGASEEAPVDFEIVTTVHPGDAHCPEPGPGQAVQVATGSIVAEGPYSIVRMWEARVENGRALVSRPFPPRFFIEEQGCDIAKGDTVLAAGTRLGPAELGTIAGLGLAEIQVAKRPVVTLFSSGNEVIPFTEPLRPGAIRDCNAIMLAAAITEAGGVPRFAGIMRDDFDAFVTAVRQALGDSDMIVISGGTAVDGRDFISDLLRAVGELVVDGVPMRSGRPLIMGVADGKPLVCVAGHPPEALRGFRLFGVAAIDRLTGRDAGLPPDPAA